MNKPTRIQKITALLEDLRLIEEYGSYLPTPEFVKKIVVDTNEGRLNKALTSIKKAESVLIVLEGKITPEDKTWYTEIIHKLRRSVLSA